MTFYLFGQSRLEAICFYKHQNILCSKFDAYTYTLIFNYGRHALFFKFILNR